MSLQIAKNVHSFATPLPGKSEAQDQGRSMKVLIPYDGSESSEMALDDLRAAGLPQALDAIVAVTNVWLPLSPYDITRAVSARRMRVLTAGASSFVPALKDHEEQRVLSIEAEHRISSIFPSGTVRAEAMQDTATVTNEILRKAKQWGTELIIVGSHSSPSSHITDYAGPALKVAREAHCSVRIARASDRKGDAPIRIIIAVDGTMADVVDAVADRVWPLASETRLVAVRKEGPRDSRKDAEVTAMLDQAAQALRAHGLTVSISIRDGKPQDVLLYEAREFAADCIFIHSGGSSHKLDGGHDRRGLSKVAEALVLMAHCSVEIVRAKNFDQYLKPAA